jgi:F-type H+-transporting ATPase subunit b
MSQLFATFGINTSLLIMQAINFGLLLLALWYFLYRPLFATLDKRRQKIAEGVRDADEATKKLALAEVEKDSIIKSANGEAEKIVAEAKTYAVGKGDELVKEAQAKSAALLTDATLRAEEAKRLALKESEAEVARLAILGAEKVLRERLQ